MRGAIVGNQRVASASWLPRAVAPSALRPSCDATGLRAEQSLFPTAALTEFLRTQSGCFSESAGEMRRR